MEHQDLEDQEQKRKEKNLHDRKLKITFSSKEQVIKTTSSFPKIYCPGNLCNFGCSVVVVVVSGGVPGAVPRRKPPSLLFKISFFRG